MSSNASDLSETITTFRNLEANFFSSLSPQDLHVLTLNSCYSPTDLYHYGEFAFLLSNLRPCILIYVPSLEIASTESRVHDLLLQYIQAVWIPSIRSLADMFELRKLSKVSSPHAVLDGAWVCINMKHADAQYVQRTFFVEDLSGRPRVVSEADMARVLDYPSALPEVDPQEHDQYIQIAYLEDDGKLAAGPSQKTPVMTCFISRSDDLSKVKEHFAKYSAAMRTVGITLQLACA
ncbi:uncharacterized protein SPPG_08083 [Spizellomyces punctatus DAOM BR117]|uniref:Uncharacterized protein n=1 Tax=Spizellomyces punctatus (strain DAOM BR117) TaxID=645134 RepID=A0A0L0H694_SPIPD|nr:uncharacterized protein SPPG_08083 [Spizellomyces punctatus DAOM BR117]KNC96494.1 hypothetical protein SPPG_08083 [Spizellomyces punctatus DAOM BR117]|eukprot:XP_016604534.1 hypothetical protein SPPG_08083 [Spizellomyces punctatus DAOM BR117]